MLNFARTLYQINNPIFWFTHFDNQDMASVVLQFERHSFLSKKVWKNPSESVLPSWKRDDHSVSKHCSPDTIKELIQLCGKLLLIDTMAEQVENESLCIHKSLYQLSNSLEIAYSVWRSTALNHNEWLYTAYKRRRTEQTAMIEWHTEETAIDSELIDSDYSKCSRLRREMQAFGRV